MRTASILSNVSRRSLKHQKKRPLHSSISSETGKIIVKDFTMDIRTQLEQTEPGLLLAFTIGVKHSGFQTKVLSTFVEIMATTTITRNLRVRS